MDTITTTIRREPLRDIVAGRKRVEYREIKPYWDCRLAAVACPFKMRLINGMTPNRPEVTVQIDRIRRNGATGQYELHIGRVLATRNWDRKRECPKD
jgi:hypothetical protein